jgi:hypothetical protein
MAGRTNESTAPPRPVQPTEWHRLSVNVADDVADAIGTLRDRHGWSITEVVRRAVSALKFIDDEVTKDGGRILVERDGTIREIKFL